MLLFSTLVLGFFFKCACLHLSLIKKKTKKLLHRRQAQTLFNATPPVGKIHPFSKMAVTFELHMGF